MTAKQIVDAARVAPNPTSGYMPLKGNFGLAPDEAQMLRKLHDAAVADGVAMPHGIPSAICWLLRCAADGSLTT
jgi:hypothetical protein